MSWRTIVISKRAKLDLQLGYMVVRSEEVTKIVLSEISTIENDVKMYGIQTKCKTIEQTAMFENDVKMYSIQTVC